MLISTEPATGAELWNGAHGDADAEVAAARAAWAGWARTPLETRISLLRRFADLVRENAAPFADLIARETGKPLWEAKGEVDSVINKVALSIEAHAERTGDREVAAPGGARGMIRHKPHGVLAVLGPYNFPAHLPNGHIVPALLAGNAIVFKPSEKTPATGEMLVRLYREAGIPEGVVRLLVGALPEGKALAAHPGIDGLLFTGSAGGGAALARQFAETPHRILALEMGGNNPLVVWNTPDVQLAAETVVQSAFFSAGQRCTCARRLIVRDGAESLLVEAIKGLVARLVIDHPHSDPAPFSGPLIDMAAADHVFAGYQGLVAKGGVPLIEMTRPRPGLPFLTPALVDVTDVTDRADEEFFGPLLQMIRVPSLAAAIAEANNTRFGLSASILDADPATWELFWAEVRAGVVNWNRPTNGAPSNAPFGGIGLSGNHRPSAWYAADYCAYPVTSTLSDSVMPAIPTGLQPTG